jgi:hypothetical protein
VSEPLKEDSLKEAIGHANSEEFIASDKAQRAELHRKIDEVLGTIPLGQDPQSEHFQVVKYVIDSAHNATASKRQGAPTKGDKVSGPLAEVVRRLKAKEKISEPWEETIARAKDEEAMFNEKAQRSSLHWKLDGVLATIPLGRDRQSEHFLAIKYVIESAHNATASKKQGTWSTEKTKSS